MNQMKNESQKQRHVDRCGIIVEHMRMALDHAVISTLCGSPGSVTLHVQKDYFSRAAQWLNETLTEGNPLGTAVFLTLFAVDTRPTYGCFTLYLAFLLKGSEGMLILKTEIEPEVLTYPAVSAVLPAAEWFEREIHDLFGIVPAGIPLEPLVLHRDWPRPGFYPMRKDYDDTQEIPCTEVPHQFGFHFKDKPEEAHEVAVGPIHAGIIEPGHLRFSVTGEKIHHFDAQLFYTHKGIEKMLEGKTAADGISLSENVCGMCSFANSTAFCQAVENLAELKIPPRAEYVRLIGLELERMASHMADLSAICAAGGYSFGSMQAARFRERFLFANQFFAGHRFLRGLNKVGGLKRNVSAGALSQLTEVLDILQPDIEQWEDLILSTETLMDRLETTGVVTKEEALTLGLVGPAARSADIDVDIRRDYPYGAYSHFSVKVPVYQSGDVLARVRVRIDEVFESIRLIQAAVRNLPEGEISVEMPKLVPCEKMEIVMVESAKGALVQGVMFDFDSKIYRWHIRSGSYMNWRGVVTATMGNNIVPDGPLVNKSFNLCYACTDR